MIMLSDIILALKLFFLLFFSICLLTGSKGEVINVDYIDRQVDLIKLIDHPNKHNVIAPYFIFNENLSDSAGSINIL